MIKLEISIAEDVKGGLHTEVSGPPSIATRKECVMAKRLMLVLSKEIKKIAGEAQNAILYEKKETMRKLEEDQN